MSFFLRIQVEFEAKFCIMIAHMITYIKMIMKSMTWVTKKFQFFGYNLGLTE
jgi:hypothetical protein